MVGDNQDIADFGWLRVAIVSESVGGSAKGAKDLKGDLRGRGTGKVNDGDVLGFKLATADKINAAVDDNRFW